MRVDIRLILRTPHLRRRLLTQAVRALCDAHRAGWLVLILGLGWGQVPAHAQSKAVAFMVAGQTADTVSTVWVVRRGRADEANPLFRRMNLPGLVVAKSITTVALVWAVTWMDATGHPRVARIIGYLNGGVGFAAAVHNGRVGR